MRDLIDLVERAQAREFSDAFRNWFGQSKAVDASGNPLVLFHGTGGNVSAFDPRRMIWASVDYELANDYAMMRQEWQQGAANVMPVYMRIEQPFNADLGLSKAVTIGEFFNAMMEQAHDAGRALPPEISDLIDIVHQGRYEEESGPHYDRYDFWLDAASLFGSKGKEAIDRVFDLLGFDGVMMIEGGNQTYGVRSPRQVKSAIGNGGGFDPESDDVTETACNFGPLIEDENDDWQRERAANAPVPYDHKDGFMSVRILPNVIWLDALYANRKGGGRAMLDRLIAYADAHVLKILLLADGDDRLVEYYEDFGFKRINRSNDEMERLATGLKTGKPTETLDGNITYDARDGSMNVIYDEDDADGTVLTIMSLDQARPGGADRMMVTVLGFARSQRYDVRIKQADPSVLEWHGFERDGDWWVCGR